MKQIKTIAVRKFVDEFDAQVNKALKEGWTMTKRYIYDLNDQCYFVAELEREEPNPEAVHYCSNCRHLEKFIDEEPCSHCITANRNKWEAVR